jgi:hypothetical protein
MIIGPEHAAAALAQVRDGVITGEGPTTEGRAHFSRTLDAEDAALCQRILLAPGADAPVSRDEAEMLFEIDAAAAERTDDGRFDELFLKAVAHYSLAAMGERVPPRAVALSPDTPIQSWAAPRTAADVDTEIREWLAGHVRGKRLRSRTLMTIAAFVLGTAAPLTGSWSTVVDLLA